MKLIGYAFFISYRQPTLALFLRVDNFYSLNERRSLGQTKSMVSTSGVFPSDAEVYLNVSPEGETAAAPPRTRKLERADMTFVICSEVFLSIPE